MMQDVKGNSEEYNDPILYDTENDFVIEVPFLSKWASKPNQIIIDLACGTGRVTLPLAKEGYKVIGVDLHTGMIDRAKAKAAELNLDIEWFQQDCCNLDLKLKSNLIYMVGNSFQHFLSNQEQDQLFTSVNQHLELEGVFIFNTRFPSTEELLQPNTEEYWRTYTDKSSDNTVDVYTISNYDSLKQIQHYKTIRKIKNNLDEMIGQKETNIYLRYTFPKELERLISQHSFEIIDIFQDWNEKPISNGSYEMVYVCRKVK
ncbi:class I SAM-dependent methyltransferase [Cytobacillus sp. FJAT-54145]|uniref:Class I SAM-dependent methyltransferase n=1 Tax=Cytobacillus spartinae TaxID=3299023 RepID=A0ABW6KJ11_9BACI